MEIAREHTLNPDTATRDCSIWKDFDRESFELQTKVIHQKQHVAGCRSYARTFPSSRYDNSYPLSFEVERSLADDFAFIAACQPKVEYVTAVTIELTDDEPSMLVRLAANEGIPPDVQNSFNEIFGVLRDHASRNIPREFCQERIFNLVVELNSNRILGRLESSWFQRPPHMTKARTPLPGRLRDTFRQNMKRAPRHRGTREFEDLDRQIADFESAFKQLEDGREDSIIDNVKCVIIQAFHLTNNGVELPERLRSIGFPDLHLDGRDIREVGKVSNYWRISRHLSVCSQRFRSHFRNLNWLAMPSYLPSTTSRVQSKEYVHAEMQLLVHHELNPAKPMPRAIGVSKEACFLCDSFIHAHGRFSVTGAHRQMYPQWAVPDLQEFSPESLQHFRYSLSQVFVDVRAEYLKSQKIHPWIPFPLQSAINLNVVQLHTPTISTPRSERTSCLSQETRSIKSRDTSTGSKHIQAVQNDHGSNDILRLGDSSKTRPSGERSWCARRPNRVLEEVPIDISTDEAVLDHTDWVQVFATASSAPVAAEMKLNQTRPFKHSVMIRSALRTEESRRKVYIAELPVGKELTLVTDQNDLQSDLSFVLVGLRGEELHIRCQWHI